MSDEELDWRPVGDIPADCRIVVDRGVLVDAISALYAVLNVEGAAKLGARAPAYIGLDVERAFDKVRGALSQLRAARLPRRRGLADD